MLEATMARFTDIHEAGRELRIPVGARLQLVGDLVLPESPRGLVLFGAGSDSSGRDPLNRRVARALNEHRLATLLLDLLTVDEQLDRVNAVDVAHPGHGLAAATLWAQREPRLASLPWGYFGAGTGAGAALWGAAELGEQIGAVVSCGGRPDLATERLAEVRAPVLLIVGGHDEIVVELNCEAQTLLQAPSQLAVLTGAGHLFDEPGQLEAVAWLAAHWFEHHLARGANLSPRP
jgi:putative phosphoribosyl transferase